MSRRSLSLAEANQAYQEKFHNPDYKILSYKNARTPVLIYCPVHGELEAKTYSNLMCSAHPCPECGKEVMTQVLTTAAGKRSDEEYLAAFPEVHGDKYTYNMERDEKYRITLICPKHGESRVLPSHILKQHRGCPGCAREVTNNNILKAKAK